MTRSPASRPILPSMDLNDAIGVLFPKSNGTGVGPSSRAVVEQRSSVARIYSPSTYRDLRHCREVVYRTLRQMRHDVVAMEDYVAADERSLAQCLADVEAADVYVGIVAWRYGYTPPKDNPDRRSITELEYRHAVKWGKVCLLFLLDPAAPWPEVEMDGGESQARIRRLRRELEGGRLVSYFKNADELATQVSVALAALLALTQGTDRATEATLLANPGRILRLLHGQLPQVSPALRGRLLDLLERLGHPLVFVPAGEFLMGSDELPDERPQHAVTLDAYWIDPYPVTNAQYAGFVEETGQDAQGPWRGAFTPDKERHPVVNVSWGDARAYGRWCSKRLPTEAEWEKAARDSDGRRYPWGNRWDGNRCNVSGRGTTPVGAYPAGVSPYGCHDMAGNVVEWVADWYDAGYYAVSPSENPQGPVSGTGSRVVRGGAWLDGPGRARAAFRYRRAAGYRFYDQGFRLVCGPTSLPPFNGAGRLVCSRAEEGVQVAVRGQRVHLHIQPHLEGLSAPREAKVADGPPQPVDDGLGALQGAALQQHQEATLVNPAHRISIAHLTLQQAAGLPEQPFNALFGAPCLDPLQACQAQGYQHVPELVGRHCLQGVIQPVLHAAAVHQPGQGVVYGLE
jgi:sulfatase modifying factor 1